jgi:succinate dehydrogenase / fumarate reductase cytochrome b subunit
MWLIDSSIGRKFIMSITGVFLVLFLAFHSIMNFVAVINPEGYNAISAFLGANWYALIATMVLAGGFIVHILYALYLSFQNMRARGNEKYAVNSRQDGVSWSSQNMLVLGVVVLGFLALHLFQFWSKMQLVELMHKAGAHIEAHMINGVAVDAVEHAAKGAYWVKYYFMESQLAVPYAITYIVWLCALWFHLTHGVWSALQTVGLNNKTWLPRVKSVSNVVATIIILLFMAVPVCGLLKLGPLFN